MGGGAVAHVEAQRRSRLAAEGTDFRAGAFGLGLVLAAVQRQRETGAGEAHGDGPADAAARAGDQYALHGFRATCVARNASKSGGSRTISRAVAMPAASSSIEQS